MTNSRPPVIDYEGSDYQTRFWDQADRRYEDAVEAVALRRLLPGGGKLLLEIGAGAGRNTLRYAGFARVVLLDYSFTQLQQAQARLGSDPRYIYVAADVYRLPFVTGLFDAATMIRVLHHIAAPEQALAEIRAALQPGGTFILEFANKQNLKAMARYWLGRQAWNPFSREAVEFVPLNFDFHPAAVRDALRGAGFAIQRQLTVSHYRMDFFKRLVPHRLLVAMDSLAQLTGDWWQLSPSVFVRAAASTAGAAASAAQAGGPDGFFACPTCRHTPLTAAPEALTCANCGAVWPVRGGIYDFRGLS